MQLRKATRGEAKLRIGFSGVSGSGKTKGALLVAYGITGDWSKIAVVDSENNSADLYADMGEYNVLPIDNFSSSNYVKAIKACENEGMEVIILDGISNEWQYILDLHASIPGNSFINWGKVKPKHKEFKNAILQSKAHVFTTVRRDTEYQIDDSLGKTKITKLGTKEITEKGWEYELTINFEINRDGHLTIATKDRTGLFAEDNYFVLGENTGKIIAEWAKGSGADEEILLQAAFTDLNNIEDSDSLNNILNKYASLKSNQSFKDTYNEKVIYFNNLNNK